MITKIMKLSDIKISDAFARTHVSERKLQKCRDYFEKFGKPDREIVVASDEILTDGYIMYLIYKENNIEEIEVKVEDWGASSYRNERCIFTVDILMEMMLIIKHTCGEFLQIG